jgi:hypothetical protein
MNSNESKIEKIVNNYQERGNKESNNIKKDNCYNMACQVTIYGNFNQEIIEVKANPKKEIVEIHAETCKKTSTSFFKRFILKSKTITKN